MTIDHAINAIPTGSYRTDEIQGLLPPAVAATPYPELIQALGRAGWKCEMVRGRNPQTGKPRNGYLWRHPKAERYEDRAWTRSLRAHARGQSANESHSQEQ